MATKPSYHDDLTAKLEAASGADPERKRVMLYLPPQLYQRLKAFSEARRVSMNQLAIIAIESLIDHAE